MCIAAECPRKTYAKGMCEAHYRAARRGTFDPVTLYDARRLQEVPFEVRLAASIEVADCWEWTKYKDKGYGQIRLPDRLVLAHRWVWENLVGPIPDRLVLDHLCRNRPCVNPDHLEQVTQQVNVLRGFRFRKPPIDIRPIR